MYLVYSRTFATLNSTEWEHSQIKICKPLINPILRVLFIHLPMEKIYSSPHETGYPQWEVIKHSCFSFGLMIKVSLIPAADRFHQNLGTKPSAKFNSSCHAGHRANTIVISKITWTVYCLFQTFSRWLARNKKAFTFFV